MAAKMIYQILIIVVDLARPMSCIDPFSQSLEKQWEDFQININLKPTSRAILIFF